MTNKGIAYIKSLFSNCKKLCHKLQESVFSDFVYTFPVKQMDPFHVAFVRLVY